MSLRGYKHDNVYINKSKKNPVTVKCPYIGVRMRMVGGWVVIYMCFHCYGVLQLSTFSENSIPPSPSTLFPSFKDTLKYMEVPLNHRECFFLLFSGEMKVIGRICLWFISLMLIHSARMTSRSRCFEVTKLHFVEIFLRCPFYCHLNYKKEVEKKIIINNNNSIISKKENLKLSFFLFDFVSKLICYSFMDTLFILVVNGL